MRRVNQDNGGLEKALRDAKLLFSSGPLFQRTVQQLRPYICPFHQLLELVPDGSSVLDVGCGSGIFLGLLTKNKALNRSVGFDSSGSAIAMALTMQRNLPEPVARNIAFEHRNANEPWPSSVFDVVTMIDVMHHVPPEDQRQVFEEAIHHVAPGGLLLYKDMAHKPAPLALANRLHDLVMARQWIHYAPIAHIKSWGLEAGLRINCESRCRMIWYAHEWIAFQKPAATR